MYPEWAKEARAEAKKAEARKLRSVSPGSSRIGHGKQAFRKSSVPRRECRCQVSLNTDFEEFVFNNSFLVSITPTFWYLLLGCTEVDLFWSIVWNFVSLAHLEIIFQLPTFIFKLIFQPHDWIGRLSRRPRRSCGSGFADGWSSRPSIFKVKRLTKFWPK